VKKIKSMVMIKRFEKSNSLTKIKAMRTPSSYKLSFFLSQVAFHLPPYVKNGQNNFVISTHTLYIY